MTLHVFLLIYFDNNTRRTLFWELSP